MDKKCLVKCPTKFLFASWYVLMLKLQHFGHLMQRADSLEKTLMLGKIEGKRKRRQWRMRWSEMKGTISIQCISRESYGANRTEIK